MAVQINPTLSRVFAIHQQVGWWQQVREGISRSMSVLTRAGGWLLDSISSLFFAILRVVWPTGADKAEVLWGRLTTIYERVKGAMREDELKREIQILEEERQFLRESMGGLAIRVEECQVETEHWKNEIRVPIEERDRAREQRDTNIIGKAHLIRERDQLALNHGELKCQLQEAVKEKEVAIEEKKRAQVACDQALQEVVVIQHQLEQRRWQDALLIELQRIDRVYTQRKLAQVKGEHPPMTELELEQLIPLYERQKANYEQMVQKTLKDLSSDHELQVPLQGILRIFTEEVGHLKRISKAMHMYAELEDPFKQILEVVRQFKIN